MNIPGAPDHLDARAPALDPGADLLRVRELNVWFDLRTGGELHAVRGVDLTLRQGSRLGLVGESGCGKTTAILALMGLLPSSASIGGEVILSGENILASGETSVRPHRWKDIAMVFQGAMNAFNPVKTMAWQISEPMRYHGGRDARAQRARTLELLDLVGIASSAADRYPHELSGGMRQRAAIAMALACEPQVLLADEPTTALDVMVQAQILRLLVSLTEELGLALVFVSHDLPAVAQVTDSIAVMYAGRIVEEAATSVLFADPQHPYTQMLVEATPDIRAEGEVSSIPGTPPRLDRPLTGCSFAPRCRRVIDRCETEQPADVEIAPNRRAACHLAGAASGPTTEPAPGTRTDG